MTSTTNTTGPIIGDDGKLARAANPADSLGAFTAAHAAIIARWADDDTITDDGITGVTTLNTLRLGGALGPILATTWTDHGGRLRTRKNPKWSHADDHGDGGRLGDLARYYRARLRFHTGANVNLHGTVMHGMMLRDPDDRAAMDTLAVLTTVIGGRRASAGERAWRRAFYGE